ncbi:unnamed protein product [Bursaphelenchus xylophilus]|uniref:(pine wood nematode) hypothetical protein n=1 Tax=Bursaphelenchus xylophilus TaxID=6326 RepID=A0A811K8R0_BURXY|nr:unnamed protein product [Bursaphelenchus xylophilus]CAG9089118.1 unnamed protein product [Bursaphelenchus xylophilus]
MGSEAKAEWGACHAEWGRRVGSGVSGDDAISRSAVRSLCARLWGWRLRRTRCRGEAATDWRGCASVTHPGGDCEIDLGIEAVGFGDQGPYSSASTTLACLSMGFHLLLVLLWTRH